MIPLENAITILKAEAQSAVGARLNQVALEYMAYTLAGSQKKSIVSGTFRKLWKGEENRFSHQYAFEARANGQTLGIITCELAFKLYNRLGYQITGEINKPAYSLYRMAKMLV
ncbi:hypothetical protein D3C81_372840 [compost metagenome]